ncbi:MAG: hypothetical protein JO116_14300, partial [Planctomycetaceae bacterium]|nr:hypothetical protein [Planctomycetaceae bacterium]
MPATTGMKGAGYYDRHSTAQLSSIQALQDWVEGAVADLPLPAPAQPVTVLDLGSSEGRNAIHLMGAIVAELRRRTDQPLQTIYSDLASNNFNQLFANLEEARRAGRFAAGVYLGAVGGSFYGPLLPPGTVHLATCFNAIHWLDRLPAVPVPDFVGYRRPHSPRPGLAVSPEAAAAFTRQAEQDLVRFLECRARELVPGAKLLLASPGDTDEARVCDGPLDVLNDACLDLVAVGRLEREGYERLTYRAISARSRSCSNPWSEWTPPRAVRLPSIAPRLWRSRRLFSWSSGAATTWRPTPGPTPASCVPSPSRWYGRPSTNRR